MPFYKSVGPKFGFRADKDTKLSFDHEKAEEVTKEAHVALCEQYVPLHLMRVESLSFTEEASKPKAPSKRGQGK